MKALKAKAKPVSRSVYQKKAEECKRLKNDLYEIAFKGNKDVFNKWRKHFKSEAQWTLLLREAILKHSNALTNSEITLNQNKG